MCIFAAVHSVSEKRNSGCTATFTGDISTGLPACTASSSAVNSCAKAGSKRTETVSPRSSSSLVTTILLMGGI